MPSQDQSDLVVLAGLLYQNLAKSFRAGERVWVETVLEEARSILSQLEMDVRRAPNIVLALQTGGYAKRYGKEYVLQENPDI